MDFCLALKTSTGGKSKDRSNPLEDLDEAEWLLERVEIDLEAGHPLREGGRESQDDGAEKEVTDETRGARRRGAAERSGAVSRQR